MARAFKYFVCFFWSILLVWAILTGGTISSLALSCGIIILPALVFSPALFFLLFTVVRPIADFYSNPGTASGGTIASTLTILLILFYGKYIFIWKNREKRDLFLTIFSIFFLTFILLSSISSVMSQHRIVSLFDSIRLISILISIRYASIHFSKNLDLVKLFCKTVFFSSIVPLAFGAYQFFWGRGWHGQGYNRLLGTFTHPNVFAEYLLILLLLVVYFYNCHLTTRRSRAMFLVYIVVILFEMYGTYTRNIWIATFFSALVLTLTTEPISARIRNLVFFVVLSLFSLPILSGRFADIFFRSSAHLSSWDWRLQLWADSLRSLKDKLFIGSGLGAYEINFGVMAHNDYIRIAYESGVITALTYIAMLLFFCIYALQGVRRKNLSGLRKMPYKVAFCAIGSLLIASFADNLLRSTVIMFYFLSSASVLISSADGGFSSETPTR